MRTFLIYAGFDRDKHIMRTSDLRSAIFYCRKAIGKPHDVLTVRDVLGGLRAEFHKRETHIHEQIT